MCIFAFQHARGSGAIHVSHPLLRAPLRFCACTCVAVGSADDMQNHLMMFEAVWISRQGLAWYAPSEAKLALGSQRQGLAPSLLVHRLPSASQDMICLSRRDAFVTIDMTFRFWPDVGQSAGEVMRYTAANCMQPGSSQYAGLSQSADSRPH